MLNGYQIAAVARRTGLSVDTIRAWERRYTLVSPARGETGVREYSESDIERLSLARAAVVLGHPIRRVAKLSDEEMRALIAQQTLTPSRGLQKSATRQTVDAFLEAVLRYDLPGAESCLNSAALLFTPQELVLEVLSPLMHEVGRRWEASALSVAQEHFASHIVRSLIGSMMRMGPPRDRGAMLFVTPPEELHEFGILFAATLASLHGVRSIVLGPSVPARDVVKAARVILPTHVVVGVVWRDRIPDFVRYVRELRAGLSSQTSVYVGGEGVAHLPGDGFGPGVDLIADLAGFAEGLRKSLP